MSIRLMTRVFKLGIPSTEKFVLLALADFGQDDGTNIFPSVPTLAQKVSMSERTVQGAIKRLEALGYLCIRKNRQGGRARTPDYVITLEKGADSAPITDRERVQSTTKKGAENDRERVQKTTKKRADSAPDSSVTAGCDRDRVEGEDAKQQQKRNGKVSAATSAAIATAFESFKPLNHTKPFGPMRLQLLWAEAHSRMRKGKGNTFHEEMEEVGLQCQAEGVNVPRLWWTLKELAIELEVKAPEASY